MRGEKREVVDRAHSRMHARSSSAASPKARSQRALLEGVAATFSLDAPPKRIEVYDNSHIQGAHAVGAMIVAGPEGFQKSEYRKFNIKSADLTPGDDLAMMREVLMRRFGRLMREADDESDRSDKWNKWPDLVLIDGGPSQVDAAYAALAEVGAADVAIVGMAKSIEREVGPRTFLPSRASRRSGWIEKSPVLYFLQRLRDEAHRFAIGGHRKKRSKAIGASPLDEIAGVGRSRKKALLQPFRFGPRRGAGEPFGSPVRAGRKLRPGAENLRILPSGVGLADVLAAQCPSPSAGLRSSRCLWRVFTFPASEGRWIAFALFRSGRNHRRDRRHDRAPMAGGVFSLGRMLDPIADKLIVAAALLMLASDGTLEGINLIPALVILCREILVSGLREFLAEAAVSLPVTSVAKFKTVMQMIAIAALIAARPGESMSAGRHRRGADRALDRRRFDAVHRLRLFQGGPRACPHRTRETAQTRRTRVRRQQNAV